MKRFGAVLGTVAAMTMPAQAETLADALTGAVLHSGLLEQNRAVLRAADEDVAQAIATLRPVISWTSSIRRQFGTQGQANVFGAFNESPISSTSATLSLVVEQVLYSGGSLKLRIDSAKELVLATRAGLINVEQQVLFRAVQAFMEVRRNIETVALRENNVRVIQQELRAARDRFEVGEVTRTDVALAEARLAAARSQLSAAQGNLVIAVEEYRAAVGRKPGNLQTPKARPNLPGSVKAARHQALQYHPSLAQQRHLVTARELAIAIAEAGLKPSVSLRGEYGVTETFNSQNFNRVGTLSINSQQTIYSGGTRLSAIRKAKAERDEARAGLHVIKHQIEQDVGNAYARLEVANASRQAFESQVRASTVAFRGIREEAKLGARTTLDVLDAEQELLDARANLVSAQVDETIAAYSVLIAMGKLTSRNLGLNVPHYDASEYYNLVKTAPAATSKQGKQLNRVMNALGKE